MAYNTANTHKKTLAFNVPSDEQASHLDDLSVFAELPAYFRKIDSVLNKIQ